MNYIDAKYLQQISGQLGNFKRKDDNLYNFRCPYCGDSQTNLSKARGYVFLKEGKFIFKCHNCGTGASLANLLKHVNPEAHREYIAEKFVNKSRQEYVPPKKDITFINRDYHLKTPLKSLKKISQLRPDHPAKKYVEKRRIPPGAHRKLFYAPKFASWVNSIIPNKLNEKYDEPRLVIPFYDENEKLFGFQGRAFGKSAMKYITIMLEDKPKIFGLEEIDKRRRVFAVEGPIDSLFLPNSIAMAGSDFDSFNKNNLINDMVIVYDNESRSSQIISKISKSIDNGYKVVIWPNYIQEKDINEMILSGRTSDEILGIINDNTFEGIMAKAKLSEWRKV